jgi:glutamine cyclotransferase
MDPGDFQIVNRCKVAGPSGPISHLNELEYINGEVWANVWQTDFLARIDPETCRATGVVDLSGLSPEPREGGVLNGIAYDPAAKRLLVTGKLWPRIFEIRVVPRPPAAVSD